jgi:sugar phosphate isomerase/epimerase
MSRVLTRRDLIRAGLAAAGSVTGAPLFSRSSHAARAPRFGLGLVTYNVAREWDLDTVLGHCRAEGFEAVEFRTTHAHGVERSLSPGERQDVGRRCRDAGMRQVSLGTTCEFHSKDPAEVRRNVEECAEWVALAHDIGARGVKVRPNGLPDGAPAERTLEQIGRALAECGRFGGEHGVEIWVEVHGQGTKEPAAMRRIMDHCAHPSVGVTWNSNDSDVKDGSVEASFDLLQPFVRCAHITDLWGDYPYRELFSLLDGAGFEGFTLCEFALPVPAAEGRSWLRRYRERWEQLVS